MHVLGNDHPSFERVHCYPGRMALAAKQSVYTLPIVRISLWEIDWGGNTPAGYTVIAHRGSTLDKAGRTSQFPRSLFRMIIKREKNHCIPGVVEGALIYVDWFIGFPQLESACSPLVSLSWWDAVPSVNFLEKHRREALITCLTSFSTLLIHDRWWKIQMGIFLSKMPGPVYLWQTRLSIIALARLTALCTLYQGVL
jgi:hypothetical protein